VAVTGCYVFALLAQVGTIAHQFNYVSGEAGPRIAAWAVSSLAASSIVGRLLGGLLVSKVSLRSFVLIILVLQSAALVGFSAARTDLGFLVTSACFGLTVGNLLMLQPLLLADAFGVRDYPRIYAFGSLIATVGVAGGPALVGVLYGGFGGYRTAFLVAAAVSLVALGWMVALSRRGEPT